MARPFGGPRRLFVAAHGRELLLEPMAGLPVLGRLYNGIRTHVLQAADGLFPVSHFTAGLLLNFDLPAERITVVHNGTDPAYFHPMNTQASRDDLGLDHGKIILTISRLVRRKGIDTVLRALARIAPDHPDVHYLIGGSGPDRDRLETLTRSLNLTDQVHFLGALPREALRHYYNACDVFVMPSREDRPYVEGFGIAFLEANACGKPVIGARSGGIPDAVLDGKTGLLVEPDDEAALADALLRLLTDASLAAWLGQNGRRRVETEASWDHVADQLYQAIARRIGRSPYP
jgi:phosphatidylinositol alpha-1,6-mannosyltransferase